MIIGVTGGIGSGKSTISAILSSLGANIIDADDISRQIVKKGKNAYQEIVDLYGYELLDQDGEIDRGKLAKIVFNDTKKLNLLNEITHKYISEEIINRIKLKNQKDVLVIDAAIPLKKGFIDVVDEIWVVFADEEKRISRVMERSNFTHQDVRSRISGQLNYEAYFKLADKIIYNNGDMEKLNADVKKLYNELFEKHR